MTYSDDLILRAGSEETSIRTEADAPDIKIAILRQRRILQMSNLRTTVNVKDLGRAVAARGNQATIVAEAHTTDDTVVGKVVDEIDVELPPNGRIEDGEPVLSFTLVRGRNGLRVQIREGVAYVWNGRVEAWWMVSLTAWWRSGSRNLW